MLQKLHAKLHGTSVCYENRIQNYTKPSYATKTPCKTARSLRMLQKPLTKLQEAFVCYESFLQSCMPLSYPANGCCNSANPIRRLQWVAATL
ncbi:hypothetical protein LJC16_03415 [Bacteroidales bacterium OttesenSCG-928-C19]|nr:hypothetical protein [Bacteroidales bacterium OttesenSCG-928-C19]